MNGINDMELCFPLLHVNYNACSFGLLCNSQKVVSTYHEYWNQNLV